MKKKKITLQNLHVNSFITGREAITGGRWSIIECPHTGEQTMDYLGCNSLDDFYCRTQGDGEDDTMFG